jgi:hypothetical protein
MKKRAFYEDTMKSLLICCAILLIFPFIVYSNPVPDTGQTKCYDKSQEITCPSPGEPFYGQDANYTINPQSYTKLDANGNDRPDDAPWPWAMVRDNVTGLVWEMKADDGSIHDKYNTYNWSDALDVFIATLNSDNFGGYSDWRLPTVKELMSIVSSDTVFPSINTTFFPNTGSHHYWSSTIYADDPSVAWVVDFGGGSVDGISESSGTLYVRAVRGGQCESFGNYIDNDDGTVTDTDTGLMWQKDTALGTNIWQQALSYCENLTLAGYSDWRLPNVRELQSIVDYALYNPSIDPVFPNVFQNVLSYYWSSTTATDLLYYVWVVDFYGGSVGYDGKLTGTHYVRAVRGGQCESIDDLDGDGFNGCIDNCIEIYNPRQIDCDDDGVGDICDADTIDPDSDDLDAVCDNCPNDYNPHQEDTDGDTLGNACDPCPNSPETDIDGDGICGDIDNCPNISNPEQEDADMDNFGNACDNCPDVYNPNQEDDDWDGIADACDPCPNDAENDIDGDEMCSAIDNCPNVYNPNQEESYPPQGNGIGDACECEGDLDHDHEIDGTDAFFFKADFGRNTFNRPCIAGDICNGDFSCDGDVDGTDASLFKSDFGRSSIQNPCPICVNSGPWCNY